MYSYIVYTVHKPRVALYEAFARYIADRRELTPGGGYVFYIGRVSSLKSSIELGERYLSIVYLSTMHLFLFYFIYFFALYTCCFTLHSTGALTMRTSPFCFIYFIFITVLYTILFLCPAEYKTLSLAFRPACHLSPDTNPFTGGAHCERIAVMFVSIVYKSTLCALIFFFFFLVDWLLYITSQWNLFQSKKKM